LSGGRQYKEALERELRQKFPHIRPEFSKRKKHHELRLHYGDKSRFVVFPASPSDGVRGFKRTMNDIRKELRVMGAIQ
jgi:hypothetical protein